ncbi:protein of unknown function [Methanoculleus bourgensis]|uniref:Uncharacterized protein n=1 Tax=Methanoculleus bourgensis TaxID=83986 RepID=A0A0X3BRF1_9EURY|nr:protein of unknown function [Methanoculleus bourgensis]
MTGARGHLIIPRTQIVDTAERHGGDRPVVLPHHCALLASTALTEEIWHKT